MQSVADRQHSIPGLALSLRVQRASLRYRGRALDSARRRISTTTTAAAKRDGEHRGHRDDRRHDAADDDAPHLPIARNPDRYRAPWAGASTTTAITNTVTRAMPPKVTLRTYPIARNLDRLSGASREANDSIPELASWRCGGKSDARSSEPIDKSSEKPHSRQAYRVDPSSSMVMPIVTPQAGQIGGRSSSALAFFRSSTRSA
jgi:hypothetical protein